MGTQGYLLMAESVVENTRPTPPTLPTNMVLRVLNFGIKAVVEMRRGCEEHTQSCWVRNEVEVFTESQSSPSLIMVPSMWGFCFSTSQLSFSALGPQVNPYLRQSPCTLQAFIHECHSGRNWV